METLEKLDYTLYLEIAGRYVQLGMFISFVVGCFLLWRMTARISLGHDLIGRIVVIVLFMALMLMGFGPDRVVFFRILVYGSISSWIYFNVYYFNKYPLPAEIFKDLRRPEPGAMVFVPKAALFRYLLRDSPELTRPWWFSHTFRNILIGIGALFLLAYGFSQTISGYTWGFKLAAMVQQQADQKTKLAVEQAVSTAVDSVKKAISAETEPLKKGQQRLDLKLDYNRKEDQDRDAQVKKDLKRANARQSRPAPFIFLQPSSRGLPTSNFSLPDAEQVVPPQTELKIKKYRKPSAELDSISDSTLAKNF